MFPKTSVPYLPLGPRKNVQDVQILSVTQWGRVLEGDSSRQEGFSEMFLQTTRFSRTLEENCSLYVKCAVGRLVLGGHKRKQQLPFHYCLKGLLTAAIDKANLLNLFSLLVSKAEMLPG